VASHGQPPRPPPGLDAGLSGPKRPGLIDRGGIGALDRKLSPVRYQATKRDQFAEHAKLQEAKFPEQQNRQANLRPRQCIDTKRAELRLLHDRGIDPRCIKVSLRRHFGVLVDERPAAPSPLSHVGDFAAGLRALAEGTPPEDLLTVARRPTGFGFAMAFVFYNGGPILLRSAWISKAMPPGDRDYAVGAIGADAPFAWQGRAPKSYRSVGLA